MGLGHFVSGVKSSAAIMGSDEPDLQASVGWFRSTYPVVTRLVLCALVASAACLAWRGCVMWWHLSDIPDPCVSEWTRVLQDLPCRGFVEPGQGFCYVPKGDESKPHSYPYARFLFGSPPFKNQLEWLPGEIPSYRKRPQDVGISFYLHNGSRVTARLTGEEAMCASFWLETVVRDL